MKKILVAGPDNGLEFGWCLMRWQAKVRHEAQIYNATYVITTPDRMFMYEDFAKPYTQMKYKQNMWRFDDAEIDYIRPHKDYCCSMTGDKFIKFQTEKYVRGFGCKPRIALHMRKKKDGREWSAECWQRFFNELKKKLGEYDIISIGIEKHTHKINGISSYKKMASRDVLSTLSHVELVVGPSSGPMHLASLCGIRHLVWSDRKTWNLGFKKGTNRERYETAWNPLGTPVKVIDSHGWNPPVDLILEETIKFLEVAQ